MDNPFNTKVKDKLLLIGATEEVLERSAAYAYNELLDYGLEGVGFDTYFTLVMHEGPVPENFEAQKIAMGAAARRAMTDPNSPTFVG